MHRKEIIRRQILADLERLHDLILQVAAGNTSARQERDRLEGALQVKFAFWRHLDKWK